MPYDTAGNLYNDVPLAHCKECGKKLELTCEFDTCIECQSKNIKVEDITKNFNKEVEE
jgi:hypothetical protein